jgi:queuine tRNA-ribosyltransferase subunit QTRTD1
LRKRRRWCRCRLLTAPSPFRSLDQLPALRAHGGPGRAFLGLPPALALVASARDPCAYAYSATRRGAADAAAVETPAGARHVTPEGYMEVIRALAPDAYVALSDEVPASARADRVRRAVDRSAEWLDRCLAAAPAGAAAFAAVQGGAAPAERARAARAAAARAPALAGFALAGLGTGESRAERAAALAAMLGELPRGKARLAQGLGAPDELLDAVAAGVDLFDDAYAVDATEGGYALSFPLGPDDPANGEATSSGLGATKSGGGGAEDGANGTAAVADGSGEEDVVAGDDSKLNLRAGAHRLDARPLVAGCPCAACAPGHSRAYLHHLLLAHEMTAEVLLEAHNATHLARFLAAARAAVRAGRFGAFRAWHAARRRRAMSGVR